MVCVNKPLEEMLFEIGNSKKIKTDRVVPFSYCEKNPGEVFQEHGDFYWLRQYETELNEFLQTLDLPVDLRFTANTDSPVRSALENAYVHAEGTGGKTANMKLPINLEIFLGDNGIIFTITDSGEGFDFNKVVEMKRDRKQYFNACRGNGFEVFDVQFNQNGKVPYEISGEGSRINIMYGFN